MTITEFLLARIQEDEAVAKAAQQGRWYMGQNPDYGFDEGIWVETKDVHEIVCIRDAGYKILTNDVLVHGDHVIPLGPSKDWQDGPHIARHDPARVLAECAAKRAIIEDYLHDYRMREELDRRNTNPVIYYGRPSMADLSHGIIRLLNHALEQMPWLEFPISGDNLARQHAGINSPSLLFSVHWDEDDYETEGN